MSTMPSLAIEEVGSEGCPALDVAFAAALPSLAALLAARIRLGLDTGRYVIDNGIVKLAEEVKDDAA